MASQITINYYSEFQIIGYTICKNYSISRYAISGHISAFFVPTSFSCILERQYGKILCFFEFWFINIQSTLVNSVFKGS